MTFNYVPLTLFKFNMYAAMGRDNPWANMMGGVDPDDDEQDTIKVGVACMPRDVSVLSWTPCCFVVTDHAAGD